MRRIAESRFSEAFVLIDTGPLVALADRDDSNNARAQIVLKRLERLPLLTVWPRVTEAIYLLGREGGYPAQSQLLNFLGAGALQLWNPDDELARQVQDRIIDLMAAYRDIPCDFADACLVAAAEILNIGRIFTFDRHFYAYRTADGGTLDILS